MNAPLRWGVPVDRAPAVVLGVPDQDHPVVAGHFDATTAVRAAERALTPAQAGPIRSWFLHPGY